MVEFDRNCATFLAEATNHDILCNNKHVHKSPISTVEFFHLLLKAAQDFFFGWAGKSKSKFGNSAVKTVT